MAAHDADAPSVLVLACGSLPGFVAAACEAETALRSRRDEASAAGSGGVVLWAAPIGHGGMHHTVAAAERQAGLLAAGVAAADPWLWRLAEQDGPAIEAETIGLIMIRALQVARSLGATRVIWPAWAPTDHAGEPIVERVAAAIDAATLASRFASTLGHLGGEAAPAPRIETPLADLTDRQVADLADDFSLDFSACWWHRTGDEHPWAAAESARWHEALAAATGVRP